MMSVRSLRELVVHFGRKNRLVLIPMLVVVLLAAVLLAATQGIAVVAPFVYALF